MKITANMVIRLLEKSITSWNMISAVCYFTLICLVLMAKTWTWWEMWRLSCLRNLTVTRKAVGSSCPLSQHNRGGDESIIPKKMALSKPDQLSFQATPCITQKHHPTNNGMWCHTTFFFSISISKVLDWKFRLISRSEICQAMIHKFGHLKGWAD